MKRKSLYESVMPADARELGRLVKKYGPAPIAEWALTLQPPRMGRPAKFASAGAAGSAEWIEAIECVANDYRKPGSPHSNYLLVARLVYLLDHGGRKNDSGWKPFLKTFTRQRRYARQQRLKQLEQADEA
jgi:hypothetical protein